MEKDVDLAKGTMKVSGKTGERIIPIPSKLCLMLARYKVAARGSKTAKRPCRYFFRDWDGGQLTPNALNQLMNRISQLAGIQVYPHLFRHTWASLFMARDGSDVLSLQALAGWSSLAMTKVYVKPSMDKLTRSQEHFSPLGSQ